MEVKQEKKVQSDYLKEYKCQYCDGSYCKPCKINKKTDNERKKNDLYEEPRVR